MEDLPNHRDEPLVSSKHQYTLQLPPAFTECEGGWCWWLAGGWGVEGGADFNTDESAPPSGRKPPGKL